MSGVLYYIFIEKKETNRAILSRSVYKIFFSFLIFTEITKIKTGVL